MSVQYQPATLTLGGTLTVVVMATCEQPSRVNHVWCHDELGEEQHVERMGTG